MVPYAARRVRLRYLPACYSFQERNTGEALLCRYSFKVIVCTNRYAAFVPQVYAGMSAEAIPVLAACYAAALWRAVGPLGADTHPEEWEELFPREADRAIAWDTFDRDREGE